MSPTNDHDTQRPVDARDHADRGVRSALPLPPDERLMHTVHDTLRNLPPRRAPYALEARVLQELQQRRTLAWWRRSFAHWPVAARSAFVAICVALSALTMFGGVWELLLSRAWHDDVSPVFDWAQPLINLAETAAGLAGLLIHPIPTLWTYAALLIGALLYAVLFGIGAAGYRILYLQSVNDR